MEEKRLELDDNIEIKDEVTVTSSKKLTEEEVKEIEKAANETMTDEDKAVAALPSNNGVTEATGDIDPITEEAIVSSDPNTDSLHVMNDREQEEEFEGLEINDELKKLLTMTDDELYKVPESMEEIEITENMLKGSIVDSFDLNEDDVKVLLDLIAKYRAKIPTDWYDNMPEKIKLSIDKQCMEVNNNSKAAKNLFASEVLDTIVRETKMDKIVIDMQKSISEAYDMSPLMEMIVDNQKTAFETELEKKIDILNKKAEESDNNEKKELFFSKAKLLSDIKNAFYQSYTYEDMIDKIKKGKLRVKKIDIDKYGRHIRNFNYKYEQDTPFIIHDVSAVLPVLLKKLSNKYEKEQIARFVIAFIKYTVDMKATEVVDHTFMSYFISNILNLSMISDTKEKSVFCTTLLANICKGIDAINNIE